MRTIDLIKNPNLLNEDTIIMLRKILTRHPYYQTVRLLLLENLYKIHSPEFNKELKESALLLADRKILFNFIEGKNYEIEVECIEDTSTTTDTDRTLSLIENYLEDKTIDIPQRSISISEAAQDYAGFLMQMEEEEKNESQADIIPATLLESFVPSKERKAAPHTTLSQIDDENLIKPEEDELPKEEYFTETLAQIYIKQHKYERAMEIIKAINLNNPKKSSYFADQIRFLEKLILINKNKN